MMRQLIGVGLLSLVMGLVVSGPASSHHSHAMFDYGQKISITGNVTEFTFRNPHGFLFVDVEEEDGEVVNYWIELGPIPAMIQRGILYKTFVPGDLITVSMYPLKDGRPGGNHSSIVGADGRTYAGRPPAD